MYELRNQKNELRETYGRLRRELDPAFCESASEKICRTVLGLASYRFSDVVLMYYPKPDEVNVLPVAEQALRDGKRVAFPACGRDGKMDFYEVSSLDGLTAGLFGIPEPDRNTCPVILRERPVRKGSLAICLIPALLYDRAGYRLGYGRGYYDRYLSGFGGTRIGIVYSDFVVDSVPRGRYDLAADVVVTEKGVRSFYEGKS